MQIVRRIYGSPLLMVCIIPCLFPPLSRPRWGTDRWTRRSPWAPPWSWPWSGSTLPCWWCPLWQSRGWCSPSGPISSYKPDRSTWGRGPLGRWSRGRHEPGCRGKRPGSAWSWVPPEGRPRTGCQCSLQWNGNCPLCWSGRPESSKYFVMAFSCLCEDIFSKVSKAGTVCTRR